MAITSPALAAAILAAGPEFKGPDFTQLATVYAIAVTTWWQSPTNLVVNGVTSGTAGAGTVNGKLSVSPNPAPMVSAFSSAGLAGALSPSLARAMATGLAATVNSSGQYTGVSPGVGAGSDTVVGLVPNTPALVGILMAASLPRLAGYDMKSLATALATGTSAIMATGKGIGAVTGPTGPLPAASTSISRVL